MLQQNAFSADYLSDIASAGSAMPAASSDSQLANLAAFARSAAEAASQRAGAQAGAAGNSGHSSEGGLGGACQVRAVATPHISLNCLAPVGPRQQPRAAGLARTYCVPSCRSLSPCTMSPCPRVALSRQLPLAELDVLSLLFCLAPDLKDEMLEDAVTGCDSEGLRQAPRPSAQQRL